MKKDKFTNKLFKLIICCTILIAGLILIYFVCDDNSKFNRIIEIMIESLLTGLFTFGCVLLTVLFNMYQTENQYFLDLPFFYVKSTSVATTEKTGESIFFCISKENNIYREVDIRIDNAKNVNFKFLKIENPEGYSIISDININEIIRIGLFSKNEHYFTLSFIMNNKKYIQKILYEYDDNENKYNFKSLNPQKAIEENK